LIILIVAVTLIGLGGAAAPARPAFTALATVAAAEPARLTMGDGMFFVSQFGPDSSVRAYRLTDGVQRWHTGVSGAPAAMTYLAAAGVLVLTGGAVGTGAAQLVVLDAATGTQLWRRSASIRFFGSTGLAALVVPPPPSVTGLGELNEPGEVNWVDLRTGRTIWTRAAPNDVQFIPLGGVAVAGLPGLPSPPSPLGVARPGSAPGLPDPAGGHGRQRLLMIDAAGAVQVLDEDTGVVQTSRQLIDTDSDVLPGGLVGTDGVVPYGATVLAGRLLVQRPLRNPGAGRLTAYDLATLTPLWRTDQDLGGYPVDCGSVFCLLNVDSLVAVDPDTGARLWRSPQWLFASALPGNRLLGFGSVRLPVSGLGQSFGFVSSQPAPFGVLAARTGRTLLDLRAWTWVGGTDSRSMLLARGDRTVHGLTWFGVLDPAGPAVHLLGALQAISPQTCQAANGLLACQTTTHTVRLWRYGS
jgi:hypothetical protein